MKLKLEDLSFSYESYGQRSAPPLLFDHLFLTVESGRRALVLAPSGSGKSTLCSLISLVTPRYNAGHLEGSISFGEKSYDHSSQLLDFFSLVPQSPGDWLLATTPEDEIAACLESLGLDSEEIAVRLDGELAFWDLERYRDSSSSLLSGGEKKRLALAVAFATKPEIVVFDESFDDLDAHWKSVLRDRIMTSGCTSVVTSCRFMSLFRGLFDDIYILSDGRLERISEEEAERRSQFSYDKVRTGCGRGRLDVRGLTYRRGSFSLSVPAFDLEGGLVTSLHGSNGSGKSTFSRLLCALEKRGSGHISINSTSADDRTLMRSVGYVFQNPDYQIFLPTVRDELSYAFDFLRISREEKERRLEELAHLFRLDLDESALLMGYGKRKRLQCAIYYSLDRPFYILDEIEAALSYDESLEMVRLLASRGAGVLVISHDDDFARAISDRSYVIEEGLLHEVK